jgi:hypothetical protein
MARPGAVIAKTSAEDVNTHAVSPVSILSGAAVWASSAHPAVADTATQSPTPMREPSRFSTVTMVLLQAYSLKLALFWMDRRRGRWMS